MTSHSLMIAGIALLAAGTFLMRVAGYRLGSRLNFSPATQTMLSDAATTLLLAVAATSALFEDQHFAGFARVTGVGVALLLAWRKAPLMVIIIAAAAVTALLRGLGIP
ncbi:inner membrane protein [Rahnella aquatilis CIP 78.65 = ATCC 33071]|uniref:Branched-chain amino acid transport protein (AzlD) n=1 Tax=Rahnella aquatilis (strain ATCC 33071 / DSM 4594 / JCM 1683 / NBRC 105701 / NCIMB 13365 / CIP 78.65) TaxID=745277 RepID=H2IPI2_RAHAC|nr:AzlD domain-containing protein [Rahnella aquatilis]AEX53490.1 Branched-chain amino acid transport protein (AzlD) [Rahnella aquatilis CIP 78.65 = ATCC 33071]KFD03399.1 inner membrane protein [Rahnella aquatilis CIP 78.65 = ATCC 33071]